MAKILVADDNSNVQKTVALALADLGVEVLAVNNGEAAVRKLSEVVPDLILADIFMPVRNGYEVCEYVKKDGRFSHLPVVLLVGAFDPLDEREAQRVGADGILKKPFVPPDPLIAMVRMLLERTLGERLVTVGASEPAVAIRGKVGGIVAADPPSPAPTAAQLPEELPEEELRPPVDRVSFGDGARPIAFGQLLDVSEESAPAGTERAAPVEDEQILTSSRDASLGDPIFWRTEEPEPENPEGDSETGRDITSDLPMRAWKPDEEATSRNAEADFLQPVEPFELVREENDEVSGQASTMVEPSAIIAQDAASQASLNVDARPPDDLAANPIEWMASVPPPPVDEAPEVPTEWGVASAGQDDNQEEHLLHARNSSAVSLESQAAHSVLPSVVDAAPAIPLSSPPVAEKPAAINAVQVPEPARQQPSSNRSASGAEDTARSIPLHDWPDLATSLQSKTGETVEEKPQSPSASIAKAPAVPATETKPASANSAPPPSTKLNEEVEDTAHSLPRHDWADLAASLQGEPAEPVNEKPETAPALIAKPRAVPAAEAQPAPVNSAPPGPAKSNQSTEDTAHTISKHDWADLATSLQSTSVESGSEKAATHPAAQTQSSSATNVLTSPAATVQNAGGATMANGQTIPANSSPAPSPDPVLVETIVQRILDKMRPQVVEIITKEFLRPIVQALVQREVTKR